MASSKNKKRPQYISKGQRRNVALATCKAMRRDRNKSELDKILRIIAAWKKGKRTYVPAAFSSTGKREVAREIWGSFRKGGMVNKQEADVE